MSLVVFCKKFPYPEFRLKLIFKERFQNLLCLHYRLCPMAEAVFLSDVNSARKKTLAPVIFCGRVSFYIIQ